MTELKADLRPASVEALIKLKQLKEEIESMQHNLGKHLSKEVIKTIDYAAAQVAQVDHLMTQVQASSALSGRYVAMANGVHALAELGRDLVTMSKTAVKIDQGTAADRTILSFAAERRVEGVAFLEDASIQNYSLDCVLPATETQKAIGWPSMPVVESGVVAEGNFPVASIPCPKADTDCVTPDAPGPHDACEPVNPPPTGVEL